MKNIIWNVVYQGKNFYRDKSFLFWCLIYPLIMAIFFYTAFSGLINIEIENINVGIDSQNPIRFILEEIEFLNVHKISEGEVKEKLENDEIQGFIDKDLNLSVKKSGLNQTIIKEILDQIKQMGELRVPFEKFDFSIDYVLGRNQKADAIIIIFYSLIAMVSAYAIFPAMEIVGIIQANLSNVGKRMNITPLRKNDFLLGGVVISLTLNLLSNIVLLLFIKYILKINLFTETKYSTIFIIVGNLFGVALGMFIGSSNKQSGNVKTLLGIGTTLVLSFFSGMMSPDIKIMIDQKIPIVSKINPLSIITDNLYKINLLENTQNVTQGILTLLAWSTILICISYGFLRRKTYDSI